MIAVRAWPSAETAASRTETTLATWRASRSTASKRSLSTAVSARSWRVATRVPTACCPEKGAASCAARTLGELVAKRRWCRSDDAADPGRRARRGRSRPPTTPRSPNGSGRRPSIAANTARQHWWTDRCSRGQCSYGQLGHAHREGVSATKPSWWRPARGGHDVAHVTRRQRPLTPGAGAGRPRASQRALASSKMVAGWPLATLTPPARPAGAQRARLARATSRTWTKSRRCPPSSKTTGATPRRNALMKMLARPSTACRAGPRP